MNRKFVPAAILATAALMLGSAGSAWATDPVPTADEQCGFQGEQADEQNDDKACGLDEKGQTGADGEKQTEQNGTDEKGAKESTQTGTQGAMPTGQKGEQQSGEQQNGEHED